MNPWNLPDGHEHEQPEDDLEGSIEVDGDETSDEANDDDLGGPWPEEDEVAVGPAQPQAPPIARPVLAPPARPARPARPPRPTSSVTPEVARPVPAPPTPAPPARPARPARPRPPVDRLAALAAMDADGLEAILIATPRNARLKMVDNRYRGAALRRLEGLLGREAFRRWLADVLRLSTASAENYMLLHEIWEPLVALIASGGVAGVTDIEQLATQRAIKHARDHGLMPSRRSSGHAEEGKAAAGPAIAPARPARKARGRRPSGQGATDPTEPPSGCPPFDVGELSTFLAAAFRGEAIDRPLYGGISLGDFLRAIIPGPAHRG